MVRRSVALFVLVLLLVACSSGPPAGETGPRTLGSKGSQPVPAVATSTPKEERAQSPVSPAPQDLGRSSIAQDVQAEILEDPAAVEYGGIGATPEAEPPRARLRRPKRSARSAPSGAFSLGTVGYGMGGGGYGTAYGKGVDGDATLRAISALPDREGYAPLDEKSFVEVQNEPLSTFSVDVDTASYTNVRRILQEGRFPPAGAVRVEEFVNYFDYDYPAPQGDQPFSVRTEIGECPWDSTHRLVHVGLKAQPIRQERVPARNLVFLIDVSGSMASPDKLPLLKSGLELLVRQLRPEDRLAMVVYAGSSGLVLDSTSGDRQHEILAALERLSAGGSTHGSAGIELAYQVAQRNFTKGGINRVILATDGDFNVGTTNQSELQRLIERKRETGVFLTVLGFGRGNLQDSTMELLADKGNGNYAYIDSMREAQKVLVREAGSTLVTVAKDVKLQVEFNPARVASYRLVGYENRVLASRDFNDDTKDAGEMGAGHTVTALYEIVPKDSGAEPAGTTPEVDALRYQMPRALAPAGSTEEALTVKVRYKTPTGNRSEVASFPVPDRWVPISDTTEAFQWSAAVAGFAQWLRRSPFKGKATLAELRALAARAQGKDPHGDRRELVSLMDRAGDLAARFPSDGPPVSGSVAW